MMAETPSPFAGLDAPERVMGGLHSLLHRYGFRDARHLTDHASLHGNGAKGEIAWLLAELLRTHEHYRHQMGRIQQAAAKPAPAGQDGLPGGHGDA